MEQGSSISMDDSWRKHGHVDEAMDHLHHGEEAFDPIRVKMGMFCMHACMEEAKA